MNQKSKTATSRDKTPDKENREQEAGELPSESQDDFVIFRYTRAEAINDGVLMDASELAREAGFRYPVALTSAAWAECVTVPPTDHVHDEIGRLWDVLSVLRFTALNSAGASEVRFIVQVCDENERCRHVHLKSLCGPGDNGEPVITIMLPHED